MGFLLVLVAAVLAEVVVLQALFRPGFIAPDLVLLLLLARAYTSGRGTILWAIFGGALLDLLTDTIGLNLALQVSSVYLFLLIVERFLFRSAFTFLFPAGLILLFRKLAALLLMRSKFSFEISTTVFLISWAVEIIVLSGIYFLYLRKNEQT